MGERKKKRVNVYFFDAESKNGRRFCGGSVGFLVENEIAARTKSCFRTQGICCFAVVTVNSLG
jgi:hypothetical protein